MATCQAAAGDLGASGDLLYGPRSCPQEFIDFVWDAYDFDKEDWDQGFGYWQACDLTRPLARTFNALWCLEFSAPDFENESYDAPILNWAGRFARENIDELDGRCAGTNPNAIAHTQWGAGDEYTELYMGFFFGSTVSMRASTIIHEARHADWVGHDEDGNDSSWGYNGAWRFQVSWLAWFIKGCQNSSTAMKVAARQRANAILNRNFVEDPGFRIGPVGTKDRGVEGISRHTNKLDVFAIGSDGGIRTAAWEQDVADGKWRGWWRIKSGLATPGAPVSAVARTPNHLDVFVVGNNGGVLTAAWAHNVNNGKWGGWWPIGGVATLRGSLVTAVSRSPTQIDVFVVDKNGGIRTAAWDKNVSDGKWRGWWPIASGAALPGGPVSALSRGANKLDVFVVGNDQGVYTASWDTSVAAGAWQGWTRIGALTVRPGTRIGVVARTPDNLDVFAVGEDGTIQTAAWEVADGNWRGWWQIQSGTALPGSAVGAVARTPSRLDVFVVGGDGGVYTAAWAANVADGKWQGWWRIKSLVATPGALVSAVARDPEKLDVFVVGGDGAVYTAAWDHDVADGNWRGWWLIAP
jgi:hypothetical protein